MEAKEVIQKILAEAESQAAAIAAQARRDEASRDADLERELKEFEQETARLSAEAAQEKKSRIMAAARMANARDTLAAKQELMGELYGVCRERLNSLPDNEYRSLMADLMKKAVVHGDEEVMPGRNEHRIDQQLVSEVNAALGSKGNLRLSGSRDDIDNGFVLVRGNIRTNVSVSVLLERVHDEIENRLAAMLFG